MSTKPGTPTPQYEPHERPPPLTTLSLGVQSALLVIAPIALFPIVLVQAVGGSDADLAWAVFAMLFVNGAATILQAFRVGPVGSGLLVITYPSPTAIPFCIIALQEGGPTTLAALIVVSSIFQIMVSMRLSLLRRLVTPAVSGAILILLVITIVPVVFGSMNDVPDDASDVAGPACILVTFALTMGLLLRGNATLRTWSTLIGIAAGSAAGIAFGIYDFDPVREASVAGLPLDGWPGLDLGLGVAFWSLLPAFLFLSIVSLLQGTSIALSIQRVSWRESRAIDYRRVQGLSVCTALGNLLAGLAAVMPVATSPRGTVFAQQTGCAARDVGIVTGAVLVVAAFFPKSWSLLIGIPAPVTAIFLVVMLSPLLVEGMKMIVQDAPDYRTSLVIGSALLVGIGLQTGLVPLPIGDVWETVFQKAFTAGGVTLVLLTLVVEFRRGRQRRLRTEMTTEALPQVNDFLASFAVEQRWGPGDDGPAPGRCRRDAVDHVRGAGRHERRSEASDRAGEQPGTGRRAGVRQRQRLGRKPGRPDRAADQRRGRGGGAGRLRARRIAEAAAALRGLGDPPAVPRHRRDRGASRASRDGVATPWTPRLSTERNNLKKLPHGRNALLRLLQLQEVGRLGQEVVVHAHYV